MDWTFWMDFVFRTSLALIGAWMLNKAHKSFRKRDYPVSYWHLAYAALILIALK